MQKFGKLFQNGYVVRDMQAALDHWVNALGVGPFYIYDVDKEVEVLGQPCRMQLQLAVSYWNDVNIELTVQHDETPSPYTDFLGRGRAGLQQLGVLSDDFSATEARILQAGFNRTMLGDLFGGRVGFYNTDDQFPGTLIELVEETPMFLDFLSRLKRIAADWDGKDPIRPFESMFT